jgi:dimethylglycine dehydrogenase
LGPALGQENLWIASGFNVGIGTGGGSAEFLARWMNNGMPPYDLKAVHADRFGMGIPRSKALSLIRAVYARGYKLPDTL